MARSHSNFNAVERGRPPLVTSEQLKRAFLSVRGREPTFKDLAEFLNVSRATIYAHVPGQEALVRLACDKIFEDWTLPLTQGASHWTAWAFEFARSTRSKIEEYPVLLQAQQPQAGAQLVLFDRIIGSLVELGCDRASAFHTFYAVMSLAVGTAGATNNVARIDSADMLSLLLDAIEQTDDPLVHVKQMIEDEIELPGDPIFDDLVIFALQGIAARRGELLPEELRDRAPAFQPHRPAAKR